MYHELLLHASVPAHRHTQVLSILAGVTAQPPTPIEQRQYIFSPTRMPAPKPATKGGSQEVGNKRQIKEAGDVYMLRLVHEVDKGDNEDDDNEDDVEAKDHGAKLEHQDYAMNMGDTGNEKIDVSAGSISDQAAAQTDRPETQKPSRFDLTKPQQTDNWQLRFYDTPEPGKKSVTSRLAQVTDIVDGDAISFVEGMGYSSTTQYLTRGHRFVHNNIIIHMFRILSLPTSLSTADAKTATPSTANSRPLDTNNGYLLEATIRLLDGGQPDLVAQGTQELTQFRESMKGALDLRIADRLSLDTKVTIR